MDTSYCVSIPDILEGEAVKLNSVFVVRNCNVKDQDVKNTS